MKKIEKLIPIHAFIISLCITIIASSVTSTSSNFEDTGAINSYLRTAIVKPNFSGQDEIYYYHPSSDKIDKYVLNTSTDELWGPDKDPVIKEMQISNDGDIDFFYTLTRDSEWPSLSSLEHAMRGQVFINDDLAFDGDLRYLVTQKHEIKIGQTSTIKFIISLSDELDDRSSDMAMQSEIKINTFIEDIRVGYTEYPNIQISGKAIMTRESLYIRSDTITSNSVIILISTEKNIPISTLEYSTNSDFSESISIPFVSGNNWNWSEQIDDLSPGTTYFVRTIVPNPSFGSGISDVATFTTLP